MKIAGLASDIVMEKSAEKFLPLAYHGGSTSDRYYGGSQSAGGKYPYSLSAPSSGLFLSHHALRQGARVAMQESPQGRAIVDRKVDAIAGTGIKLEPTPDITVLGITREQAAEWAKDVSARFHLYMSDKRQHRSEQMTGYQAQRFYAWCKERDNDVFVRFYYSTDKTLQNPLQFEFLDADQIRGFAYTTSWGFQAREDGIIRDERGRETGYKVWVKQADGTYKDVEVKKKGPKSGRIFMLHGFRPEYAGQGRGYTKLAPILQELENFTSFSLAHITQAINQAMVTGWVVPSKDEDTVPPFDNLAEPGGVGHFRANTTTTATDDEDCSLIAGDFDCQRIPEARFDNPGIFLQSLTKGADIKFANANAPVTGYDKFEESFISSLSVVSGLPREMVVMKFGNNYSASRATLLLAYRVIEIDRADNDAEFHNPLEEMWLAGEIAAGRISAPGWSDPRLRAAWLKSTWRGAPVPDIDPKKLADGIEKNLIMGRTNIERESQLNSGISAADNIDINNRIFEDYEILPFTQQAAMSEAMEPDEDEED
jgi:capsid protein